MDIDVKKLVAEFEALKRQPDDLRPGEEAGHVSLLLGSGELSRALADYDDPHAIGVGGTSLILDVHYRPHDIRRAIKLPRRKITLPAQDAKPLPILDPELHALSKVSHKHITRLLESHPLPGLPGHCMVTELVPEHLPLDQYAVEKCASEGCRRDPVLRQNALLALASQIYLIVDALVHMHEDARLLHFDLKPDNILVSKSDRPYVTDLGFARDMSRYGAAEKVDVGFTYKYSHWRLHDVERGARVTTVPEKSRNVLRGEELHPRFDLFAFGRTLQEVLKELEKVYGKSIYSDYTFTFIHLVACLCLDGLNSAAALTASFVSDQALEMPLPLFGAHKFSSFREVRIALERLLGYRELRLEVPELDEWAAGTINVSDLGITTLTPRVKALIEHPLVSRLTDQRQLGLLDTVFPTSTHTRFQHSLGVYHATGRYITALYYDPENPTFRILFSEEDCKVALIATIIHDVGHTTFGHDLEEVDEEVFSHVRIGRAILEKPEERDRKGRLITDLIAGTDPDCWAVPMKRLRELLANEPTRPIHNVYHDILDGQLDADKLDYLVRDSVETRVRYGHGIDHQRFLRSLTTAADEESKTAVVRLAIKQKGAASAEAFAFARYQLYQALYWHHTFRSVKAMLLSAASHTIAAIGAQPRGDLFKEPAIRQSYIEFVIRGKSPSYTARPTGKRGAAAGTVQEPADQVIARRLATKGEPPTQSAATHDRTLAFLWRLSEAKKRVFWKTL